MPAHSPTQEGHTTPAYPAYPASDSASKQYLRHPPEHSSLEQDSLPFPSFLVPEPTVKYTSARRPPVATRSPSTSTCSVFRRHCSFFVCDCPPDCESLHCITQIRIIGECANIITPARPLFSSLPEPNRQPFLERLNPRIPRNHV